MIQRTSAATQGIVAASQANGFSGFLATVEATARAFLGFARSDLVPQWSIMG